MRQKPVTIEVRKNGQNWAVLAEEQLIALTVYQKGAQTLEAVLRGLLRYTSRKLFRLAVSDAMKGPKPSEDGKPPRQKKPRLTTPGPTAKKPAKKKSPVKKEQVHDKVPAAAVAAPSETASDGSTSGQPN